LRLALAPSNSAHAFTFQNVAELPWKSRFVNTVQYNMMRQDEPFVSTAINGLVPTAFPASSANAEINTLLVNNVLTTQIAKDVRSKLRYRYYDLDNNTPELFWTDYVRNDSAISGTDRRNLALAYTKQNASADLTWRATDWLTVGGGYGWEQYDRSRRDVNVTNEHSGRLFFDTDLFGSARMRNSILYAVRRYDNYDAVALVEDFGLAFSENTEQMRKFDIANRDRLKLESFLDIPINQSLTVTPNFGLLNDRYPNDVVNQLGVTRDEGWNAGIEVSTKLSADLGIVLSYNYEERERFLRDCCGGAAGGVTPANIWSSEINNNFHTYIVAADWKAVPDRLTFKAEYLLARSSEENDTTPCSSGATGCTGGGTGVTTTQFPTEHGDFQRFSLTARYVVDPTYVRQMGWQGEVFAKLRYIYERNRTVNWAIDDMTPYIPTEDQTTDLTGGGRSIFLAAFNPNYDAQIVALSFGFKW
jgi:MtrB/PioB family decaheme-associated outer membrane protein